MTEDVTYLIDAEDKASAKVRKSKDEVNKMVGEVKDLGGKSKASAELVGTLANQIGSTGAGQAAGEVAQLVERISAFSEVAKSGGKGALFLKAGIAAAAGVIAFKLGKALGDAIFQTERWQRVAERQAQRSSELADRQVAAFARRQQMAIDLARTLGKAGEQEKLAEMLRAARAETQAASKSVEDLQQRIIDLRGEEDFGLNLGIKETINVNRIALAESELEANKKLLASARSRAEQLEAMTSPMAKQLRIAQEQAAADERSKGQLRQINKQLALAKAQGDDRLRLELKMAGVQESELGAALRIRKETLALQEAELQREQAAAKAKADAERERQKLIVDAERKRQQAAAQRAGEEQRIAQFQEQTINGIRLQLVEMAKGREAAEAMRLQQGGFAEDQAKRLARGIEAIRKLKEEASRSFGPALTLQAGPDDRLSTGAGALAAAQFARVVKSTEAERQTKLQERMAAALESLERFEEERRREQPQKLVVLGN